MNGERSGVRHWAETASWIMLSIVPDCFLDVIKAKLRLFPKVRQKSKSARGTMGQAGEVSVPKIPPPVSGSSLLMKPLASHYFPNEDPIGKQITIYAMHTADVSRTIVGVAGNVLYDSPDSHRIAFDGYFPYSQRPMNNEVLVLRASGDVATLVPVIRRIVASVDPDVPIGKITTFNSFIAARFTGRKTGMLLVSAFSAAALFLSAIGIYGTLAIP
jgi:hypothetical protein